MAAAPSRPNFITLEQVLEAILNVVSYGVAPDFKTWMHATTAAAQ